MVVVWIVVGVIVAAGLGVAAMYDRRARGRGSQLRSSGDMAADERSLRRSVRGSRFGATPGMTTWQPPDEKH